jgi:hypothetical protein
MSQNSHPAEVGGMTVGEQGCKKEFFFEKNEKISSK